MMMMMIVVVIMIIIIIIIMLLGRLHLNETQIAYILVHREHKINQSKTEIHPRCSLLLIYFVKLNFPFQCDKANKPCVCKSVFVNCAWQRMQQRLKISLVSNPLLIHLFYSLLISDLLILAVFK